MSVEGTVPLVWDEDAKQDPIPTERIRKAIDEARDAFWAKIAEHFPEVTTGDMAPGDELALEWATNSTVMTWLMWNHPDCAEPDEPDDTDQPDEQKDPTS